MPVERGWSSSANAAPDQRATAVQQPPVDGLFAFTDSDCVPAPDWLKEGMAALADYDFVGGRVDVSVADERSVTPTEAFEKVFAFDFETYINRKGFTGSGNLFVPRTIFEAVGGFRNAVSEDVDWSRRADRARLPPRLCARRNRDSSSPPQLGRTPTQMVEN